MAFTKATKETTEIKTTENDRLIQQFEGVMASKCPRCEYQTKNIYRMFRHSCVRPQSPRGATPNFAYNADNPSQQFADFEPTTTSTYIEQNSTSQPGPSSSLAGLSRILENESSSSRKPFHCPKCDSSFPELHLVVNHWAKAHYKESESTKAIRWYRCDECDYVTEQKQSLTSHKNAHSHKMLYCCPKHGCDFMSRHNASLNRHMRTHTDSQKKKDSH